MGESAYSATSHMSQRRKDFKKLRAAPRWAYSPTGIAALTVGALLAGLQFVALFDGRDTAIGNLLEQLVTLTAILLPLPVTRTLLRESKNPKPLRLPWLLFCVAVIIIGLSTILHALAGFDFAPAVFFDPRLSLATGLLALGALTIGMMRLPTERLPKNQWLPAGLDMVTMLLAAFLCFWVYALFPAITSSPFQRLSAWTVAAYTVVSLSLISALILLMIRRHPIITNAALAPLLVGSVVLLATEIVPFCNALGNVNVGTSQAFMGWPFFALALAVSSQSMRDHHDSSPSDVTAQVNYTLPFISTGMVGFLLFSSFASQDLWAAHVSVLLPATFSALVLIVVRQSLTARENLLLAKQMGTARDTAETANNSRLQFLANISHDLRTPLNGVLGCTQILLREKDITKKQRGLVKTMQGCAEHLRNMINDLLDLSKLESDKLELASVAFDLRNFTETLIKTFELEAEKKGISLVLDQNEDLPRWISCDRKRLQQIMGNLIHNAIKFTERGGVWLRVRQEEDQLVLEVQDTGFGIHPDKIGELFRPFHIVDERSIKLEGTGLGLSISRKLARKMGGEVDVQSTLGKGSKFLVTVPLVEAEPEVEIKRTIVDYQGRRRRILIVDDQPANRIVLRSLLEPLDFLVDDSESGADALDRLKFAKPDIILSDLMMPEMDGFEFCERFRELSLTPTIPCIAISAASSDEVREKCLKVGFCELLGKPIHLDMLLNTLQQHAGIEWSYGVIEPAPSDQEKIPLTTKEIIPPSPQELAALIKFARRGVVQSIEAQAEKLAAKSPDHASFAHRVLEYTQDFKIKELAEWLTNLTVQHVK